MGLDLRMRGERAQVERGERSWLGYCAVEFVLALFYDGLEVFKNLEVIFTWRQVEHRGVWWGEGRSRGGGDWDVGAVRGWVCYITCPAS